MEKSNHIQPQVESGLVSVLMSVFNDAAYLSEAIDSILGQTHRNLELILADCGSTDGSLEIASRIRDPRLVLMQESKMNLATALNRMLAVSHGEFLARQDADDVSRPERLARQVAFLRNNGAVGYVGSGIRAIDSSGTVLRSYCYPPDHVSIRGLLLRMVNPLPHSSLLFRSSVLRAVGGYDERFSKAEDFDLHLRLTACTEVASMPEALVDIRDRIDSAQWRSDGECGHLAYTLLARLLEAERQHGTASDLQGPRLLTALAELHRWAKLRRRDQLAAALADRRFILTRLANREIGAALWRFVQVFVHSPYRAWCVGLARYIHPWDQSVEGELMRLLRT
jgi:glycosyltransferase involved in cell wall biosynthesis